MPTYYETKKEKRIASIVDSIFSSEKIPEKYKEQTISETKKASKTDVDPTYLKHAVAVKIVDGSTYA